MKANNLRLLILFGLFINFFSPAYADQSIRYYDVELVIFENLEETSDNNEVWPKGKQLVVPENATRLGRTFAGTLPPEFLTEHNFKLLSLEEYQLQNEAETLKESEQYKILLHTGWRQPGLAKDVAVPIHFTHLISDTPEETVPTDVEQTSEEQVSVNKSQAETVTPEIEVNKVPSLDGHASLEGLITVVLSRYLHIDVEMLYRKEADETNIDMYDTSFLEDRSDREPVYYLKQSRKMRSKQTHYIDHPRIGILVRMTPFKIELPAEPASVINPKS